MSSYSIKGIDAFTIENGTGNVGIGTNSPVTKLNAQTGRSTPFNAADLTTWSDIHVRNNDNSTNVATGISFLPDDSYHVNGASGIAAIRDPTAEYMSDLAFITRGNGVV